MPRVEKISFRRHGIEVRLTDANLLRFWLSTIAKAHHRSIENLSYVFCSDHFLLEMNRQYLRHNYLTDIITFDLGTEGRIDFRGAPVVKEIQGEIYISVDRVKENAHSYGCSFQSEIRRVIIHGLLHLLGYRDKSKGEKALMRDTEDACLSLLDVPRETMRRAASGMFHVKQ